MRLCEVDTCTNPVIARGYCSNHYKHFRKYGSPISERTSPGEVKEWLFNHVDYQGDDCLEFPFAKNPDGYGQINTSLGYGTAHRFMCAMAHPETKSNGPLALHNCGNGDRGCVNPKHLRWGTHRDNRLDHFFHMEAGRGVLVQDK